MSDAVQFGQVWQFVTSSGFVALLGWAVLNERRLTRVETIIEVMTGSGKPAAGRGR